MPEENVLLVDSELLTRDLLGNHLKHNGYKVFAVDNSAAAVKLIDQSNFRLAVVNEKAGDKSLAEITSSLRLREPDALIFLITSQARDAEYLESRQLFETIVKPFRLEEVSVKFSHAVENISLKRALRASAEKIASLEREVAAYGDAAEQVAIPELSELEDEEQVVPSDSKMNERDTEDGQNSDGNAEDDVFEKIRKIDILRKAGILTSGEFNRKKKELLDRI